MSAPQAGARTSGAARRLVRALVLPLCGTAAFSGRVESEQLPAFHLGSLYEIDQLLLDENGDGVPDRLNVLFVLPESPSAADQAAAAEIALRLGFETMALDLPVARIAAPDWNEEARPGAVRIAIGARAVREAGLSEAFGLPFELEAGEGLARVFRRAREGGDERWIVVAGGDEEGLLRGARYLAGSLPGVKTAASGESLRDVADEIGEWAARRLEGLGADSAGVWFRGVRARSPVDPVRLEGWIELFGAGEGADSVLLDLLREEASVRASGPDFAPDSAALRFQGLRSVALIAGDDRVELPTLAAPPPPGPVPGRPGGGGGELDLSSVFTTQGLLSGSELPTGISAILIPEGDPLSGVIDLAARLGVESSGIAVPATRLPGEEGQAAPVSVLLGSMERHPGIQSLADSGAIKLDDLAPGEGLVRSLPVRGDPRLVATGIDDAGRARAAQSLAVDFPRLRGTDGPTFGDVEEELWAFLSGYSPAGQAAIGLYKLDRLLEEAREDGATGVHILMSVEKADSLLGEYVRAFAQARLPLAEVTVEIDDRDVTRAKTIFDDAFDVPSEAGRFREALRAEVLPRVSRGAKVELRARLSEPPEVRARLAEDAKQELLRAGADAASTVEILSAFKQGFSWLRESVLPELKSLRDSLALQEVAIRFLENKPPAEWPQQAMHTPVRWLHEVFPIDEILAAELDLALDRIRLEMVEEGPVYEIESFGPQGETVLRESFEPKWVLRPYFDRFRDYEQVRVTTGWVTAVSGGDTLYDGRIKTDPEWFWDRFQEKTLPAVYDYVMDRHDGRPRGGPVDAPFFGELTVDLALSEPDYRLGIENEIVSTMDALHEEIYFGTIEFFHLIGRHSRGDDLVYPGRIIPRMRPKADGEDGQGRIRLTGFATSRPAVVLRQRGRDGATSSKRLDIPKTRIERPASHRAVLAASGSSGPSVRALSVRVRVDEELDRREELLKLAPARTVDATISSAEQTEAVIRELEGLRDAGLYAGALAYEDLGDLELWVEWSHDLDSESRRTVRLSAGGKPIPPLRLPALTAEAAPRGERIVQWETPIPPDEGNRMLALMDASSDYATSYLIGRSYLGRPIWAMDLMSPISASHWSRAKASTFKPTVIYSARQHANEVSSTSHVLRHAELLLADSAGRARLDRVNVVIHPFTNPDGAQLAYDLYRETPDYILHAAYLASLGMDATSGSSSDFPIYPESTVRPRLWDLWLPDIFLDPHGYPSHQVVQLFSEYSGLVRRGRVTERNWGMNKGWFMPGFAYIDDPDFPRHKDAALKIRDYITRGINSNRDVFEMNQRNYARYLRYGAAHDPEVYRLPLIDSVLIEMPLKGSSGAGSRHNPEITIWRGITEAPDETAYGPWMELMAKAGLSWDQAILDYLYDGDHEVERSGSSFFGGVTLKMHRPRPPKDPAEESAQQSGARE